MLAYLLQHVVKESQSRLDVAMTVAVEVHLNIYVGLLGGALHFCYAFSSKQQFGYLLPGHAVASQYKRLASYVLCQLSVCFSVSYNVRILNIIRRVIHVLLYHSRAWFASRGIVLGEVAVDELLIESDALVGQRLNDEVMNGPEGVLGERVST